jgi:hypothetical protein
MIWFPIKGPTYGRSWEGTFATMVSR